jgi:beta-phosphoglucomutase-like phosphatase (HAD superfamily)
MISACIFDLEGVLLDMDTMQGDLQSLTPDDLKDGVFVFVKELKNKGLNLAVVARCPNLRQILNRLHITHYFHTWVGSDGPPIENPTAGLYEKAVRELGVSEEQTLVFTAEGPSAAAAAQAGCWVVGVGLSPDMAEADLVLPSFEKVRFLKILSAIGENE